MANTILQWRFRDGSDNPAPVSSGTLRLLLGLADGDGLVAIDLDSTADDATNQALIEAVSGYSGNVTFTSHWVDGTNPRVTLEFKGALAGSLVPLIAWGSANSTLQSAVPGTYATYTWTFSPVPEGGVYNISGSDYAVGAEAGEIAGWTFTGTPGSGVMQVVCDTVGVQGSFPLSPDFSGLTFGGDPYDTGNVTPGGGDGTDPSSSAPVIEQSYAQEGSGGGGGTVPSASDVRHGVAVGSGSGTCYVPSAADVRHGTNVDATTGSCYVPSASDVRFGTSVGATTGTCHVPTASQVLAGIGVDATTGNVVLPGTGQVQAGVGFGPSSGTIGTLSELIPASTPVALGGSSNDYWTSGRPAQ